MLFAHGLGARTDLPIPDWMAIYGAGAAVLFSFFALGALWREPRLSGWSAGRPVPSALQRVVDSAPFRFIVQSLTLAVALLVLAVAFFGPPETQANLAPYALYITFWVGLIPASLLLGPIWRVVNPLRLLHQVVASVTRTDPEDGRAEPPKRVGYWPAAGWLIVFVWLELVFPDRSEPLTVGIFILTYSVINVGLALWFGRRWFCQGDGFEVYSSLFGLLSPLGRRDDGRLVVRNPLNGLAGLSSGPGLVAVVAVLIGSTGFDGLTRTELWTTRVDPDNTLMGTVGLLAMIGVTAWLFKTAVEVSSDGAGVRWEEMPGLFVSSLIPIALGYAVAHYFSLLILDGQTTFILASDPFNQGVNYLGTAGDNVNYTLLSPDAIAYVQVGAIVVGHILGVVLAHDRAVRLYSGDLVKRRQQPLLIVMILFTLAGVSLLLGA